MPWFARVTLTRAVSCGQRAADWWWRTPLLNSPAVPAVCVASVMPVLVRHAIVTTAREPGSCDATSTSTVTIWRPAAVISVATGVPKEYALVIEMDRPSSLGTTDDVSIGMPHCGPIANGGTFPTASPTLA